MAKVKKNILIVEDNEDILFLEKLWLEKAGFNVNTAVDGDECIKKLSSDTDLLVSDYHMPGASPEAVLEFIRKNKLKAKVLYSTGSIREIAIKEPVAGFMVKPVIEETLVKKVTELLK